MHTWSEMGLRVPDIMLPKAGTDMEKWAVIACDQYTSEPEYWEKAEEFVGDAPSTLRLMLPEYYLGKPEEAARTREIRKSMETYLSDGTLEELPAGCILVKRISPGYSGTRTRYGLVIAVDLEAYDYSKGSTSLIRATEKTIVERIPPRLVIRRGAPVELPHIIILIDDPEKTVIEPLAAKAAKAEESFRVNCQTTQVNCQVPGTRQFGEVIRQFEGGSGIRRVYDTDLMLGGGHVVGTFIPAEEMEEAREAFSNLFDMAGDKYGAGKELLMAMGDGNHSLATAKAAWEEIKKGLSPEERANHPARFALCEIENVHDEGIIFAPIHRVMFGDGKLSGEEIVVKTVEILRKQNKDAHLASDGAGSEGSYEIPVIYGGVRKTLVIEDPASGLEVGALQNALDVLVKEDGIRIDYIHGHAAVEQLASDRGNAGFLLPSMDKFRLFPAVAKDGALPRKTFSMGHAQEKRYYLEARKLTLF